MLFPVVLLVLLAFPAPSLADASDPGASFERSIVQLESRRGWPSIARAAFNEGLAAWRSGHMREARNAWTRALAWIERVERPLEEDQLELSRLVAEADRRWRKEAEDARPLPAASPSPARTPVRTRVRRRRAPEPPAVDARNVMDRARAARREGQVEKALRLYGIAATLPGGELAAAEAAALQPER